MGGQGLSPCLDACCAPWRSGSSRGWVERGVAVAVAAAVTALLRAGPSEFVCMLHDVPIGRHE
eukprot:708948-Prymnesium_polylepis.1